MPIEMLSDDSRIAAPTDEPRALVALTAFLDDLAETGVPYCSWKSNEHLEAALVGATDLDLLVAREWAGTFRKVVARHDLKQLVPPPATTFAAMEHHLGFDRASGRLFHLHVHYQLVLGERHVKNYRLPIEREMLERTHLLQGVAVPAPELELAVLVVRALLKYRARDVVKDQLGIRTPGISPAIAAELAWLLARTDVDAVRRALRDVEVVPADVVCEFLDTVGTHHPTGLTRLRLRTRTRAALGQYARDSRTRATATYVRAIWQQRRRRRHGNSPVDRMTLATGGTTFALVGADGAGKSTVAHALTAWLQWKVDARVHYLGSKPPSLAARWTYLGFRASRRGTRLAAKTFGEDARIARVTASTRDVALATHHVATARQRARRYATACRDVAAGRVVVFDRFPLSRVADLPRHDLVDGPRITTSDGWTGRTIVRRLAVTEESIYQGFRPPTGMVVLDVDPDVATTRKPDHDRVVVAAKARVLSFMVRTPSRAGSRVRAVDADRPLDQVLGDVKSELWDVL